MILLGTRAYFKTSHEEDIDVVCSEAEGGEAVLNIELSGRCVDITVSDGDAEVWLSFSDCAEMRKIAQFLVSAAYILENTTYAKEANE